MVGNSNTSAESAVSKPSRLCRLSGVEENVCVVTSLKRVCNMTSIPGRVDPSGNRELSHGSSASEGGSD